MKLVDLYHSRRFEPNRFLDAKIVHENMLHHRQIPNRQGTVGSAPEKNNSSKKSFKK